MAFQNPYSARLEEFAAFVNPECKDWDVYFSTRMSCQPQKTILEVGCSNAEFLSTIAEAHPQNAFIGVDWKFKILYKGAKRVDSAKLVNVALLRGRIQELVEELPELDETWIFFPDPWAKKSQFKHRLMQEKFLLNLHKHLKAEAKVYFKTDHPGYFQWVLSLFGHSIPTLPDHYADSAAAARASSEKGYRLKQVQVRHTVVKEDLPDISKELTKCFQVESVSTDYWASSRQPTLFSETQTLFEKGFVRDKLPIYFIVLVKTR